jgi:hypothetical protein
VRNRIRATNPCADIDGGGGNLRVRLRSRRSAQSPRVMTRRDLKRVLTWSGAAASLCYWLNHELEGDMESAVRVVTLWGLTGAAIAATFDRNPNERDDATGGLPGTAAVVSGIRKWR